MKSRISMHYNLKFTFFIWNYNYQYISFDIKINMAATSFYNNSLAKVLHISKEWKFEKSKECWCLKKSRNLTFPSTFSEIKKQYNIQTFLTASTLTIEIKVPKRGCINGSSLNWPIIWQLQEYGSNNKIHKAS